jgi:hypothetical protein
MQAAAVELFLTKYAWTFVNGVLDASISLKLFMMGLFTSLKYMLLSPSRRAGILGWSRPL